MASETVYWGQRALAEISSVGTGLANVSGAAGQTSLLVTGNVNASNSVTTGNLITNNIIMSSNMSSGTGLGNVYFSGNLVVTGNIFSSGGSVGSGSGTSQGILFSLASNYSLGAAFSTGVVGPSLNGYHVNLATGFVAEAAQAVTQFGYGTGLLKFTTAGLYQLTCVLVGDQPVAKVGIGKTTATSFPASPTYDYVYNYPVGSSPSEMVTLPLTVTDITQNYFLDVYFNTTAGTPTLLYPTRTTTAAGFNFGTYIQVAPFGNYLTSATGVASALLANCSASSNLSGVYSSNAYRVTLTSANGWTVNGTSTSLAVTSNGNFQVNQTGIYEVNLCLNTVGQTPVQFQVGSLANDTLNPGSTTASYLYTYAPMYTQDPTTAIKLPLNITNISNVYFVECSFPGTLTGNVALSTTSTFVSIKPIGGYISTGTNPWTQQGSSVYYNGGPVGIGGAVPTALTETLTVNGNTSFVSNVMVTSDASSNNYVLAKRVPAGSLGVQNYVTGSVPLTTTTSLINNYLSNAATIGSNVISSTSYNVVTLPGTVSSGVNFPNQGTSPGLVNLSLASFYVEAWVNIRAVGSSQVIIERSLGTTYDWSLFISAGNLLTFTVWNTTASYSASNATAFTTTTGWTHVAGSYVPATTTTGTVRCFVNGGLGGTTGSVVTTAPRVTSTANVYIGINTSNQNLTGNVADVRIFYGGTVPTATFAAPTLASPAIPFSITQPSYITGSTNCYLALQTSYFPGASTSPYGPCLTLPGTANCYYLQTGSPLGQNWKTYGFTLEGWINYPTFASSNAFQAGPLPYTIMQAAGTVYYDWAFGATTTGQLAFWFNGLGTYYAIASPANSLVTGQWAHIAVQTTSTALSLYINGAIQTLTQYIVTGGTSTASAYPAGFAPQLAAIGIGLNNGYYSYNNNFAIAKARMVYGTVSQVGNVYSMAGFTPSPNLGPVPAGATVAWQLESQFPLPTYPSIQDVTQLPPQSTSFGALPTPVGGVTSNVLGPYTAYPALDSIRFDGTGYIDYGNAATSVMTSNLWASPWTIEGWVYPTLLTGNIPIYSRSSYGTTNSYDLLIYSQGTTLFAYAGTFTSATSALSLNTWQHIAVTYDGTQSNIYVQGSYKNGGSLAPLTYTPTHGTLVGAWGPGVATAFSSTTSFQGNLADLRVSNVARYSGTTYVVPAAPFATDANTLLLLKSLAGQPGTTLEVQGRGLNAVSLGATRSVQSYPPAPFTSNNVSLVGSYMLDTTGNTAVTYGQGKYLSSSSSEYNYPNSAQYASYNVFDKNTGGSGVWASTSLYSAGAYTGTVSTVDILGNSYAGEWIQLQMPVSVLLSSFTCYNIVNYGPPLFWLLGSRDGIIWTLVYKYSGAAFTTQTFTVNATQSYNFYRFVAGSIQTGLASTNMYELIFNGTEESLCITNDSKVGVGIANPQRALEVAGDLVVSGTISGGAGMGSFRNRIINGDMRIAQRGTSATTVGYGCVDRWTTASSVSGGTVTQSQQTLAASDTPYQLGFRNSLRYTITTPLTGVSYQYQRQSIEGYNVLDLNWGTSFGSPVTISFWFRSNMPTGSTMCGSFSPILSGGVNARFTYNFTLQSSGQWQYVTYTVPPPPNSGAITQTNSTGITVDIMSFYIGNLTSVPGTWETGAAMYNFGSTAAAANPWWTAAGNFIEFTGIQLEKGTLASPFEFRPYATELALCQRYMFQMIYQDTAYCYQRTSVLGMFLIRFPVTMRTGVNPVLSGTFNASIGASDTTISSISAPGGAYAASATGSQYMFPLTQTVGSAGYIWLNSAGAYIRWDAEL